jgi:hypothetical protein
MIPNFLFLIKQMGKVKDALKRLKENGECDIRPFGGSMKGRIESGQLVTLQVINGDNVKVDDAVFIKWKGNYLIHLVKKITETEVLIGNNLGKTNGWISKKDVIAKVIKVHQD